MRTLLSLALGVALLGCGTDAETAPITDDESLAAPTAEDPAEPATEADPDPTPPDPSIADADEDDDDDDADQDATAAPTTPLPPSPPLPSAPTEPGRYHVFVVPETQEDGDGDEDDLDDYYDHGFVEPEDRALFVPETDLLPSEEIEVALVAPYAEVEMEIRYPVFEHPDPRVARLINDRVAELAVRQSTEEAPKVRCTGMATEHLVSVRCSTAGLTERSAVDLNAHSVAALHLRVEDGEVHEVAFQDAFLPGTDLHASVVAACERDYAEGAEEGEDDVSMECVRLERTWVASFGRAGFSAEWIGTDADSMFADVMGTFVAYDDIAEQVLASGPLARSLHRARVRTRIAQASPRPAPAVRQVWAATPMLSAPELAMTWLRLDETQRRGLRAVGGYLVGDREETARAAAGLLGLDARQVSLPREATATQLQLTQTTRDTALRGAPNDAVEVTRALPRGTLLVALGSARDRRRRVVGHVGLTGFVDGRVLGTTGICVPDLAPVLAALPEGARAEAGLRTMRAVTRQSGWGRALYLTDLGDRTRVALRRMDAGCADERPLVSFQRPGPLRHFSITRTERGGGEPIIVAASASSLTLHRYSDGETLLSHALEPAQEVSTSQLVADEWIPVSVESRSGSGGFAIVFGESGPEVQD